MQRSIKRSIFSKGTIGSRGPFGTPQLNAAKLPTNGIGDSRGPSGAPPPNSPVQEVQIVSNVTKAIDRKLFRHQQYLKVLERFLNERCEFSQSALLDYEVVREAWYEFIRDNHDEFNKLDCNMRFAPQDVVLIDDRYQYKRVYFCRECKRRHYHKCCDGYKVGHRFTRYGMVGLSIKPLA